MAQNETWLNHDLSSAVKVQYLDGNLFSMDNAGNLIGVILTKDGVAYSGGGTVSANVIRADGGTVAVTGALSGNVATVVLPQAAYAVPGVTSVVIKLTVSGEVTTIGAVVANVYESTTSTTIDPGTIIPSIQTLVNQINTAVSSIPADYSALWTSLAPAFSTSTAYTAGQYVTYNGGLYRFVTDHAAGSWSSSDVTAAILGNDISDLKSALKKVTGNEVYSVTNTSSFVDLSGSSVTMSDGKPSTSYSGSYNCYVVPCSAGDVFTVTGKGGTSPRLWGFVNSQGTILSVENAGAQVNRKIITAPTDAAWLIVNVTKANSYELVSGIIIIDKVEEQGNDLNNIDNSLLYIANYVTKSKDDNWYTGEKIANVYSSSTFSGFASSWTVTEKEYVKGISFKVKSRADSNITEIRVRIEGEGFAFEKSMSVNIGSDFTTVYFPVGVTVPAGIIYIAVAANKIAQYYFAKNGSTTYAYKYWTDGDLNNLYQLKESGGAQHRLLITANVANGVLIQNGAVTQPMLSFSEYKFPDNLFNWKSADMVKKDYWYYSNSLGVVMVPTQNEYTIGVYTAITVPIYNAETIYVKQIPEQATSGVYWCGFCDADMKLLSKYSPSGAVYSMDVPTNAVYFIASLGGTSNSLLEKFVVSETNLQVYSDYETPYFLLKDCKAEKSTESDINVVLSVPEVYDLVVNDTFQLFFKGIINAVNNDDFYVIASCTKGQIFKRLFEITPTTAENLSLLLQLYNSNQKKIDEKTITLKARAKASSPGNRKNVLCVGDSLTTYGQWVHEMKRRLTGTGGNPAGDGLNNIAFIGTREYDGANYEGYGGWTFNSYNTENVSSNVKIITCSHDKTEALDQHSIYKDSTNHTWKLETIETNTIKIIAVDGEGTNFPETGTLTWVSGGTNHSDIVYTASENAPGNPFWDSDANKVDFAAYAEGLGVSSIDYVYVLLGWNSATSTETQIKAQAQTFIDNVQESFPNAKIVLMGLEVPARDGLGWNYGASGIYSNYAKLLEYVHNLDDWYKDLVESNSNVYHINISGQFDTEYNMQTWTRPVNTRNSETETFQSNGVHPANSGYMQIADAAYRHITGIL